MSRNSQLRSRQGTCSKERLSRTSPIHRIDSRLPQYLLSRATLPPSKRSRSAETISDTTFLWRLSWNFKRLRDLTARKSTVLLKFQSKTTVYLARVRPSLYSVLALDASSSLRSEWTRLLLADWSNPSDLPIRDPAHTGRVSLHLLWELLILETFRVNLTPKTLRPTFWGMNFHVSSTIRHPRSRGWWKTANLPMRKPTNNSARVPRP